MVSKQNDLPGQSVWMGGFTPLEWCILWNQYTAEIGDYTTLAECVGSIDWREKTTTQRMETRIREKVPRPL